MLRYDRLRCIRPNKIDFMVPVAWSLKFRLGGWVYNFILPLFFDKKIDRVLLWNNEKQLLGCGPFNRVEGVSGTKKSVLAGLSDFSQECVNFSSAQTRW